MTIPRNRPSGYGVESASEMSKPARRSRAGRGKEAMMRMALIAAALAIGGTVAACAGGPTGAELPGAPVAAKAGPPPGAMRRASPELSGAALIGALVMDGGNGPVGRITDILIDDEGRITDVVVAVGAPLGLGAHELRIAWEHLRIDREGDRVTVMAEVSRTVPERIRPRNGK